MIEWLDEEDDEWEPCGCYAALTALLVVLTVVLAGSLMLAAYVAWTLGD